MNNDLHTFNYLNCYKALNVFLDCSPGSFICKNVRQCISNSLRCDMKPDCIDGTDEVDCTCKASFFPKGKDN